MEGKFYEYFNELLFSHLPQDELRSGPCCINTDQGGFSSIKAFAFFTVIFFLFVTCHSCQFLIFPSFPDVTLFIAKGPNVIPSSLIIVMLGLNETNKKTVSSNGKRKTETEVGGKCSFILNHFCQNNVILNDSFFIGGRYIVVIFKH